MRADRQPTLKLPCDMTPEERIEVGSKISEETLTIEQIEAQKREAVAGFNSDLKSHKGTVRVLAKEFKTGKIQRDVPIRLEVDGVNRVVRTYRLDFDPPIEVPALTRAATEADLQLKLVPEQAGGDTQEQREASPAAAERLRAARLTLEECDRRMADLTDEQRAKVQGGVEDLRGKMDCKPMLEEGSGDPFFVATVDAPTWTSEAEGRTEFAARSLLIAKVALHLMDGIAQGAGAKAAATKKAKKAKAEKTEAAPPEAVTAEHVNGTSGAAHDTIPAELRQEVGDLCAPACDIEHTHTEQRLEF